MNASKKIAIGFLVFVFGMIFFSLIFAGCDKITSSNKNNDTAETTTVVDYDDNNDYQKETTTEEKVKQTNFNSSLLEANDAKSVDNFLLYINDEWKIYNHSTTDDCYYYFYVDKDKDVDDNITITFRTYNNYKSYKELKDYFFKKEKNYKDYFSNIYDYDNLIIFENAYIENNEYKRMTAYVTYNTYYELTFTGNKEYSSDIDTVYTNVRTSSNVDSLTNKSVNTNYEKKETTTTKPKADTLVYSNGRYDIYYHDITDKYDRTDVIFKVKNKTNIKLEFHADTVTLDGISYNDLIMAEPVAPKSIGYISVSSDSAKYKKPTTVGGELRCYDNNYKGNCENISFVNVKVK